MRVLLRAPFTPYSGYGNDGIGLAQALIGLGADVYLQPTVVQPPIPQEVADLLTKPYEGEHFDLSIIHLDPAALEADEEIRSVSKKVIGWTMWEYSNLHNMPGRSKLKSKLKNFDALVGYDDVTVECLKEYAGKVPVIKVQGGYNPEDWEYVDRDWSGRIGFCMNGVLSERKDPFVAIQAFSELKAEFPEEFEPAELHLHTVAPGLSKQMEAVIPKLRVHYAVWPVDILKQFYASQHVLLAPSRGEGKNMPALEFMTTGGAVVATNWGGMAEWLDKSYAYPLDYVLRPVHGETFPDTYNARASVDHLKEIMMHIVRHRGEAKGKGELASRIIPQMLAWPFVTERLIQRLSNLPEFKELSYSFHSLIPLADKLEDLTDEW